MVLPGNTLQTTPDYLRQLKQSDHNVLYSETVRFGKALADVRRNLRDLQTENDQLVEESEVAAGLLEQLQNTTDRDRKEWEAFAQTMYDEVGKARAARNVLQRDIEQQRLKLQSTEQLLLGQIASLKEAKAVSDKLTEAKVQQLEADVKVAQAQYDEAMAQHRILIAQRNTAQSDQKAALQSEKAAKSTQEAAEREAEAARQLAVSAEQERAAAHEACKQALKENQAAIRAEQQAGLARAEAEEQARQANVARRDAEARLARSTTELGDVRSELSNVKAQLTTANKIVDSATARTTDLEELVRSTQAQLEAADKAKDKAVEACKAANIDLEAAKQEAANSLNKLQTRMQDLEKQVEKAKQGQRSAEEEAAVVRQEAVEKAAETERQAAQKVAKAEKSLEEGLSQAERDAAAIAKAAADTASATEMAAAAAVKAVVDKAAAAEKAAVAAGKEAADKLGSTKAQAARELMLVKEAAEKARQEAQEQANRAKRQIQEELESTKLQLKRQEATEERLRKRLNKQDATSSKRKEALVAAQQRNSELEGLLSEAQTKIGCAAKHRKSAQKQLDAQEQDFERLGQRLKAASESPAASLPTVSPRRVSRRDVDLGLSPAAPEGSPSPNSLPYQASPDHPDPMEEDGMMAAEEEDAEEELSSEADTPEAQPARGISSWMARSVGRLIPFSTSKATKPESVRKHHSGAAHPPQPISQLTAASPAAVTDRVSQPASPAPPGRISRGKRSGKSAAGSPVPVGQAPSGPRVPAAGLKRKADQLQEDDRLQEVLASYKEAVHRPPTDEDGPPVKMPSPTRKRHRLALSSSPAADAAVTAAGDLAAEAVVQAAAAAGTPAEAATAAEHAAEVVTAAAADAVEGHAPLPAGGSRGTKADRAESDSSGNPTDEHSRHAAAATRQATRQAPPSPSEAPAATSPLEAATAVALPDDANKVVLTAKKRGRPSKADLALKRQMAEAATAAKAAGSDTVPTAGTSSEAQHVTEKDSGKSSKSSGPASKTTRSRASDSKGKKQATAAAPDAVYQAVVAASQAEVQPAPSRAKAVTHKRAPSASRKQPSASTTTAKSTGTKSAGIEKPSTAKASSAVSSDTARRTSGRLATRGSAGGSQAAGPARSTRSKSHSTASGLASLEDTASKQPQPMTPIAEGNEEGEEEQA